MIKKMKPRGDVMYVRPHVEEYEGRIIVQDKHKQTLTFGEVLAIGPNVKPDIKVGTYVYYSSFAGVRFVKDDPRSIIQLRDIEVMSIYDEENGVEVDIGKMNPGQNRPGA